MSYIGNQPTSVAFLTDYFSGNNSTTAFTMSVAPSTTSAVLVSISGVLQDPSAYSVNGTTLTFSAAPPSGSSNIVARYMGIPASGVTTTAYRTVTEFTATAGQTTFTPASYTVGYLNVFRNGVRLGAADYTATNGTTVVLASPATTGDLITTESFYVSSVLGAMPQTAGIVTNPYLGAAAVTADKIDSTVILGSRNKFINGAFHVWQRNTTFAITNASRTDTADRWYWENSTPTNTCAYTVSRSTDVPAGQGFPYSMLMTVTTAQTSAGTTSYVGCCQTIESNGMQDWAYGTASAKTAVLSFWVKSNLTGTFTGNVCNQSASSRVYPFSYTINASNTWEKKTITIAGDTAATFANNNAAGLRLELYSLLGSNYYAGSPTVGAWNANTSVNQWGPGIAGVNVMATVGNTWQITGAQIEAGTVATPFEFKTYSQELLACLRYYQNSFNEGNFPGVSTDQTDGYHTVSWTDGNAIGPVFNPPMRAAPTVTFRATATTTPGYVNSGGTDRVASGTYIGNKKVSFISVTSGAVSTFTRYTWTAESEI